MNEDMEIDLREMFSIILKRKWIIILITLLSTLAAVALSFLIIKPSYEARTSIVIGKEEARIFYEDKYTNSDIMMYQKLVKTYAEIAMSNTVLENTANNIEGYDVDNIAKMVSAVPKADTQILELKVKSNIPTDAALIANEFCNNFILECSRVLPAGELNILDKAEIPKLPVSPNKKLNIAIAFLLGLMVSIGMVFLLEYIDQKVRSQEQLERYLDIPVLVSIPSYSK